MIQTYVLVCGAVNAGLEDLCLVAGVVHCYECVLSTQGHVTAQEELKLVAQSISGVVCRLNHRYSILQQAQQTRISLIYFRLFLFIYLS